MDVTGLNWTLITVVGVILLAAVLLWAMLRNRSQDGEGLERTERATHDLYEQEDKARDPMDDGTV